MCRLRMGTEYRVETGDGEKLVAAYAGWLDTDAGIMHRFGQGRDRREVADRFIPSVVG